MKKILSHFGLIPSDIDNWTEIPKYEFSSLEYDKHLDYLKLILVFEKSRRSAIESKLSQLTGQSSIVLSLLALFIFF